VLRRRPQSPRAQNHPARPKRWRDPCARGGHVAPPPRVYRQRLLQARWSIATASRSTRQRLLQFVLRGLHQQMAMCRRKTKDDTCPQKFAQLAMLRQLPRHAADFEGRENVRPVAGRPTVARQPPRQPPAHRADHNGRRSSWPIRCRSAQLDPWLSGGRSACQRRNCQRARVTGRAGSVIEQPGGKRAGATAS
jgi:hypothetical protein